MHGQNSKYNQEPIHHASRASFIAFLCGYVPQEKALLTGSVRSRVEPITPDKNTFLKLANLRSEVLPLKKEPVIAGF